MKKTTKKKTAAPAADGTIARAVRGVLAAVGEDPQRDGLLKTPDRVERAFRFLTKGYRTVKKGTASLPQIT